MGARARQKRPRCHPDPRIIPGTAGTAPRSLGSIKGIASDDDALVAQARGGNTQALEALLRRHQPRLYAVCRRITGSDADAADALQDALIAVVRGLPRFDRRSSFGTWTYRIAVNASLDELRARSRRPEPGPAAGESSRPSDGRLEGVADRLDIDAALRQLTPEFRAAVVLRDFCELDYAEIAEVLAVPPGTVRSRIARGRAALVALLGERAEPVGAP